MQGHDPCLPKFILIENRSIIILPKVLAPHLRRNWTDRMVWPLLQELQVEDKAPR